MTNLEHLNDLYGLAEDPWHMRGDWLAERRRELVLASLHHARYTSTFVPGCGSGKLLPGLARRSEFLLAVDDNRPKLAEARARTEHLSNVGIDYMQLPSDWPSDRQFDLIVLSEMGYLMDLADWAALADGVRASLTPDATVVASHRNHHFTGRQLGTDTLHGTLDSMLGLTRQTRVIDSEFAIDVWTNRDGDPA
ncbi:MAG TPA: class I SAM-dependent methyltransferase [Jatrophihabitans sp.]|nr:class I SAM-dependent methyltransferase [Jatrophihabitans sp.]